MAMTKGPLMGDGEHVPRAWTSLLLLLGLLVCLFSLPRSSPTFSMDQVRFWFADGRGSVEKTGKGKAFFTLGVECEERGALLESNLPWSKGWFSSEGRTVERDGRLCIRLERTERRLLHLAADFATLSKERIGALASIMLFGFLALSSLPSIPDLTRGLHGKLRSSPLFPPLLLVAASLMVAWVPLTGGGLTGYGLHSEGNVRLALISLVDHGQLPAWTPFVAGGYRFGGHPECPFPSPLLLLPALLGPRAGMLANLILLMLLGGLAFWRLLRLWKIDPVIQALALLFFATQGWLGPAIAEREVVNTLPILFPALLLCLFHPRRGYAVSGVFLTGWMIVDGRLHVASMMLSCLVVLLCTLGMPNGNGDFASGPTRFKRLLGFVVGGALLAAPKLVILQELLATESYGHGDWHDVSGSLLTMLRPPWLAGASPLGLALNIAPPLLLVIAASFLLPKRAGRLVASWFCLLLIGSGAAGPLPIWKVLHALPIFSSIRSAAKYFGLTASLVMCLLVALGLQALRERVKRRVALRRVGLFLTACVLLVPRLSSNRLAAVVLHGPPEIELPRASSFHSVRGDPTWKRWMSRAPYTCDQLFASGRGVVDWHGHLVPPCHAEAKFLIDGPDAWRSNPAHRGEVYFDDAPENRARIVTFSPMRLRVAVDVLRPARLVLNQNHHPQWRSDAGPIERWKGLVSLRIPRTGSRIITLHFDAWKSRMAILVSVATSLALLAWLLPSPRSSAH